MAGGGEGKITFCCICAHLSCGKVVKQHFNFLTVLPGRWNKMFLCVCLCGQTKCMRQLKWAALLLHKSVRWAVGGWASSCGRGRGSGQNADVDVAKTKGLPGVEWAVFVSGFVARLLSAGTSNVLVYPHTLGKTLAKKQVNYDSEFLISDHWHYKTGVSLIRLCTHKSNL